MDYLINFIIVYNRMLFTICRYFELYHVLIAYRYSPPLLWNHSVGTQKYHLKAFIVNTMLSLHCAGHCTKTCERYRKVAISRKKFSTPAELYPVFQSILFFFHTLYHLELRPNIPCFESIINFGSFLHVQGARYMYRAIECRVLFSHLGDLKVLKAFSGVIYRLRYKVS